MGSVSIAGDVAGGTATSGISGTFLGVASNVLGGTGTNVISERFVGSVSIASNVAGGAGTNGTYWRFLICVSIAGFIGANGFSGRFLRRCFCCRWYRLQWYLWEVCRWCFYFRCYCSWYIYQLQ